MVNWVRYNNMIFKMKNFLVVILALVIVGASFGVGVFVGEERGSTHDTRQDSNILNLFLTKE